KIIEPGDVLLIEVLEALPGRPITGERIVRPDGTISLGFYGDLHVAGLNRDEIKEKLIQHLRKYLKDEVLGLVRPGNPHNGEDPHKFYPVPLKESDRVYVDDSPTVAPHPEKRIDELERKLDRLLNELEALKRERRRDRG
ncbi:MAG: polysaccharide biosynthesis/export family protein, partial [Isosphaeraceae bacterium]|nr:polysaccharide biosynthesis/export family protein [Isosphaeraceae bacterium]